MIITVFGAGALGGYFGARLQATGHDVTYIARGAHLKAMQSQGLRVESPLGDIQFDQINAVGTPDQAPLADLVLFMVKNYDVADAARELAPTIGPDTLVLTAQNGVSAQGLLADAIGEDRVLPGAIYMPADIKAPGVIRHSAAFHKIIFGTWDGRVDGPVRDVETAIAATGIETIRSDDIWKVLWEKFILMAPNAAITATTRLDIGPIRSTPETLGLLRLLVEEAAAIARAEHAVIADDIVETTMSFLTETVPATMHASMLDDLMRGSRLELPWLSGEIVRRGQELGIETPAHAFAYAVLAPSINGTPVV